MEIYEGEKRKCTTCGEDKPFPESFHKDRTSPTGYRKQCRDCKSRVDSRSKKRDQQPVELSQIRLTRQAEINKAAIMRLVQNHRSEFEALVSAEAIKRKVAETGETPEKVWMSLA